jgi:aminoglycoside 2''-phosphotransferase
MNSDHTRSLLQVVRQHHPALSVHAVASRSGQFNDVLIVNDEIVFRFPRSDAAASSMASELAVLGALQSRLPIPVPNPTYIARSDDGFHALYIGYRMLPGRPLDRETLDALWANDRASFQFFGARVGEFLRALHGIDVAELKDTLSLADDHQHWSNMLDAFRDELFVFMRADAQKAIEIAFQTHLSGGFGWQPALRHGDFGGGNLLYDDVARRLSGVIDFGSVALGDPAVDLAAMTAFDARLAQAMQPAYPELFVPGKQRRASFYRSTFALQQALWARRAEDDDQFNDGIASYV